MSAPLGQFSVGANTCEQALVTVLGCMGSLKDTVRLVGGLVPRYLTPERAPDVPAHAGTSDLDLVIDLAVIAAGQDYAPIADRLYGCQSPHSEVWFGAARDSRGRRHRSFDPVHFQGPLGGWAANWQSRPGTAVTTTSLPVRFSLRAEGHEWPLRGIAELGRKYK